MKTSTREISNTEDVIDSREIIERIEYLESLKEDFDPENDPDNLEWDNTPEGDELTALQSLAEEASGYSEDWQYGSTLIRDSYFQEYAEELVKDIGDLPQDIPAYIEIDWQRTAENIRQDYSSVDFDGIDYWIR